MLDKIKAGLKIADDKDYTGSFKAVKAGLKIAVDSGESVTTIPQSTVTEEAPLLPYEQMKSAPKNFPMEEYSLKPLGDERVAPVLKTLDNDILKLTNLDGSIATITADANVKIQQLKELEGYEKIKQEVTEYSKKFSDIIQKELVQTQASYQASKKILLEYKDKIYTIYDQIKETSVSDKEKLQMYQDAMARLLAPDLIKSVNTLVDQGVSEVEKAKTEIKRRFVSFPTQDKIRKMVKEELPKKSESKTAGVWDSIKGFFNGLWEDLKNVFFPVKENAADIQAYVEENISPLLVE